MNENMAAGEAPTEPAEPAAPPRPPRGYRWLPTLELEPGMVIARPVFGGSGQQLTIHLAVGSAITASTIAQLVNKAVECVAVMQDTPPDPATHAEAVERYESRLHEIFGANPDDNCRPLLDALLADEP